MIVQVRLRDSTWAFDKPYAYLVPPGLQDQIQAGQRVMLPFGRGNSLREAYIRTILPDGGEAAEPGFELKQISHIIETEPVLKADQLLLCDNLQVRYACTWGEAARLMLPAGLPPGESRPGKTIATVRLANPGEAAELLEDGSVNYINQVNVLLFLLDYPDQEQDVSDVLAACQISRSTIDTMAKKGWLIKGRRPWEPEPEHELPPPDSAPVPTTDQAAALARLRQALDKPAADRRIQEFLLFGITGSGKTEVYLQLAQTVLERGLNVIILVPEISLTPQMTARIERRFGALTAILHSRLTPRQRYDEWNRIRHGDARVVVGARSAIFCPLDDIGLIIVDEEQEGTYRSEMRPRYDARSVARLRLRDRGSLLLLGSATPSLESWKRTIDGRSELLQLRERPQGAMLPSSQIVNLRDAPEDRDHRLFSPPLHQAMDQAFDRGEQVLLFMNRRGYSGIYLCRSCAFVVDCPDCSVAMTFHAGYQGRSGYLLCHYCGRIQGLPETCPSCGSQYIGGFGIGTEQVEERFKLIWPEQRILRMDQDTTAGRGTHQSILEQFRDGEADVLLGTQMIAKGHDFPKVTVVGVLAADQLLHQSDFRSGERAFALITQSSGRAGRGSLPGSVYVQAYDVDHYALAPALAQDYPAFAEEELQFRADLNYPPFAIMGEITISHEDKLTCEQESRRLHARLSRSVTQAGLSDKIQLSQPHPAALRRLRGRTRWQISLRSPQDRYLSWAFTDMQSVKLKTGTSLTWGMDPA